LRSFTGRPIIEAAQTVQLALRLSIRSFYPKRLLQDAQKKIGVNPRPSAPSAFY
jgi:hypothetical protein